MFRKERLSAEVLRLISKSVLDISQDAGFIASVSAVRITDIKKGADVWLSVISGDADAFLKLMLKNTHELEELVFTSLPLPFKLSLHFQIDYGPEESQKIADLLKQNS